MGRYEHHKRTHSWTCCFNPQFSCSNPHFWWPISSWLNIPSPHFWCLDSQFSIGISPIQNGHFHGKMGFWGYKSWDTLMSLVKSQFHDEGKGRDIQHLAGPDRHVNPPLHLMVRSTCSMIKSHLSHIDGEIWSNPIFPSFFYCFPMVFPWFPHGFLMAWFSHGFLILGEASPHGPHPRSTWAA